MTGLSGTVKIGGDTWTARTADRLSAARGSRVTVSRIDGATAVVVGTQQTENGPITAS